ncbi:MAG TPA: hypothetical protein GX706_00315 [Candidatus Moranbacteria bacterium]|nr:hypothetical protein [Candidatus Moranbacteria bacterium]
MGKNKKKEQLAEIDKKRKNSQSVGKGFWGGKKAKIIVAIIIFVLTVTIGVGGSFWLVWEGKITNDKVVSLSKDILDKFYPQEELTIGWVTDAKCYGKQDDKTGERELNWRCIEPLESMVWKMNNETSPDLVVQGGSLIKNKGLPSEELFMAASGILKKIKAPIYPIIGEEEVRGFSKEQWRNLSGQSSNYYYVDEGRYRLVFLDTNNYRLSESGEIVDSVPGQFSNVGLIDEKQLKWLEATLKSSQLRKVLVFMHHPPIYTDLETEESSFSQDSGNIRTLFANYNVKAVFSGYLDRMCRQTYQGVEYFVLQGIWESNDKLKEDFRFKNGGIFGEIYVSEEATKVIVNYHRNRGGGYYDLEITPGGYSCLDGYTLRERYQDKIQLD